MMMKRTFRNVLFEEFLLKLDSDDEGEEMEEEESNDDVEEHDYDENDEDEDDVLDFLINIFVFSFILYCDLFFVFFLN